jgi:hypothetical protein
MARPPKLDDKTIKQLEAIMRLKPSLEDCAAFLDLDVSTITRWIRKTHKMSYAQFRDKRMVHSRFMIYRNLLALCEKQNLTALIYMSKNLCGMSDNPDSATSDSIEIVVKSNKKNEN